MLNQLCFGAHKNQTRCQVSCEEKENSNKYFNYTSKFFFEGLWNFYFFSLQLFTSLFSSFNDLLWFCIWKFLYFNTTSIQVYIIRSGEKNVLIFACSFVGWEKWEVMNNLLKERCSCWLCKYLRESCNVCTHFIFIIVVCLLHSTWLFKK